MLRMHCRRSYSKIAGKIDKPLNLGLKHTRGVYHTTPT